MRQTVLLIFITLNCVCAFCEGLDDVRAKVRAEYISTETDAASAAQWVREIREDGTWTDIDYTDRSRALWDLEKHLDRIVAISLAYKHSDDGSDARSLDAALRGLQHWFDGGYSNDNWWYAKIGMPRRILALAYILDDNLSGQLRESVSRALGVIDSDDYPARPGGDRIQVISNHAKVLLWRRDYNGVAGLLKKLESEARVAPYEEVMYDAAGGAAVRNAHFPAGRGVQADMSFHHRGDRVDTTTSYGMELPEFFAYWAKLLMDTDCRLDGGSIRFVIDYYLDGVCRHLVKGRYFEPSIVNRELSRPGILAVNPGIASGLLSVCDGYRASELSRFVAVQEGRERYEASYAGYFWQSEYFVFSRPGFQTAVRLHSVRNANQEAAHNSEGLRSHFRGDGACMLSVSGEEYAEIAPVYDFRMIPGATTPLIPYEPLSGWGPVNILNPPTRFAGAVCDSLYGAVAMDFLSPRSDLHGKKAWFFFDDSYLCLGCAIGASAADEIVTTVEQCRLSGEVRNEGSWYFHGGNGYHIIEGKATAAAGNRTGTWRNCVDDVAYAGDSLTAGIFSLAISHGPAPENAAYAYSVVPGASCPVASSYRILRNDKDAQAVESSDGAVIYMVFYAPGEIATSNGIYAADRPCMVMVREGMLSVSDPARASDQLRITTPQGVVQCMLPTNLLAGSTVSLI